MKGGMVFLFLKISIKNKTWINFSHHTALVRSLVCAHWYAGKSLPNLYKIPLNYD
jgi:hypothetical protein